MLLSHRVTTVYSVTMHNLYNATHQEMVQQEKVAPVVVVRHPSEIFNYNHVIAILDIEYSSRPILLMKIISSFQ